MTQLLILGLWRLIQAIYFFGVVGLKQGVDVGLDEVGEGTTLEPSCNTSLWWLSCCIDGVGLILRLVV